MVIRLWNQRFLRSFRYCFTSQRRLSKVFINVKTQRFAVYSAQLCLHLRSLSLLSQTKAVLDFASLGQAFRFTSLPLHIALATSGFRFASPYAKSAHLFGFAPVEIKISTSHWYGLRANGKARRFPVRTSHTLCPHFVRLVQCTTPHFIRVIYSWRYLS